MEVKLDDYYYQIISALRTLYSKNHIITIAFFFDVSSAKRGIVEKEWEPGKKPLNLIKKTEKENR